MKTVSIRPLQESRALLAGYLHPYSEEMPHRKERPCVVVCPGGAYKFCSDREADPIAEAGFAVETDATTLTEARDAILAACGRGKERKQC